MTITSDRFKPKKVYRASDLLVKMIWQSKEDVPASKDLIRQARDVDGAGERLANLFFKNAALVVMPNW